jgi:hypothetical protein
MHFNIRSRGARLLKDGSMISTNVPVVQCSHTCMHWITGSRLDVVVALNLPSVSVTGSTRFCTAQVTRTHQTKEIGRFLRAIGATISPSGDDF